MKPADVVRDGDFLVVVKGQSYVVVRSFGQLCLMEREDPDNASIEYRKW